jgi:hypothetical protein
MEAKVLRWIRHWRERDDQRLVKRPGPLPGVEPIEELIRIVNEAQECDAEDERQLYFPIRENRHSPYPRRCPGRR